MAYNNLFPASYQQYYPQYQQYQPNMQIGGSPNMTNAQNQQMMSPPTIHAEIVQVSDRNEASNFPVGTGQTQMMIAKDDSSIFIKTVYANGQSTLIEYIKKPIEPERQTSDFITREEFENRIAEIMSHNKVQVDGSLDHEQSV